MFCYFINNFSYSADWCVLHCGEGESSGYEMVVGEWMGVCCGSVFSGGPRQHSVAALWWAVQGV